MISEGRRTLLAGLTTLLLAALILWEASGHPLGSIRRIGPGVFPLALGLVLGFCGVGLVLQGLRCEDRMPEIRWRPLFAVTVALICFGFLVDRVGFVPAATLLMVISAFGEKRPSVKSVAILTAIVVPGAWLIFIAALGIPVDAFAWSF